MQYMMVLETYFVKFISMTSSIYLKSKTFLIALCTNTNDFYSCRFIFKSVSY